MKWLLPYFAFSSVAMAATYGPVFPASGTNDIAVGSTAWIAPSNVTANDVNASTNTVLPLSISNYIVGSSFDFSACPAATPIVGIAVYGDKYKPVPDTSGNRRDSSVILVVGSSTSTNKAGATSWSVDRNYGGPTDTWGLSGLTCGSLATLQVKMSATNDDDIGAGVIWIGYITVTVYSGGSQQGLIDLDDLF